MDNDDRSSSSMQQQALAWEKLFSTIETNSLWYMRAPAASHRQKPTGLTVRIA